MKLIGSPTSPYVRKVRIVLTEKRIDYEFVQDLPWDAQTRVSEYNPLGKVPVLLLDDGASLFDSRVIVEYLDTVTPVARLIPEATRQRIGVKRWEALADGICDAAAAIVIERRRPDPTQQSPSWMDRQRQKVERGLHVMAADLGDKHWCTGEAYNLADIAAGCALGFLDFRLPEISWRTAHPNLAKFADKLAQRPAFKDTVPQA